MRCKYEVSSAHLQDLILDWFVSKWSIQVDGAFCALGLGPL